MKTVLLALIAACLWFSSAAGADNALRTAGATDAEVKGDFTLILFGGRHGNDIETVAFLDSEGDKYTVEPYAPEFDYRVRKGLTAEKALHDADAFVRGHNAVHSTELRRIIGPAGGTIGFEVRPIYLPFVFGESDVLDLNYRLRDGRVIVYIRLKPAVERLIRGGDGLRERDR